MFILEVANIEQLRNLVMTQPGLVALLAYTEGSPESEEMSKTLDSVYRDFEGSMNFARIKLVADENSDVVRDFVIVSVPAVIIVKDGAPVDTLYGSVDATNLSNYFRKFLVEKQSS
jgi:thioredoxin-like negative regulator of GroEL